MIRSFQAVILYFGFLSFVFAQQSPVTFISDIKAFEIMFNDIRQSEHHLTEMGPKAADSGLQRRYRALFSLSENTDKTLKRIAQECLAETAPLDRQAAELIGAIKTQYRQTNGAKKAGLVPPPPATLTDLQEQKDATLRKYLSQLEEAFGQGGFALLSAEVRRHVVVHSKEPSR